MDESFYKRIESVLENLDNYAHCGGVYHDMEGRDVPRVGKAFCRLCSACVFHSRAGDFCRQAARAGAYQSQIKGDVHHFRCWIGLYGLVIPVAPDGEKIIGAIEIGGLLPNGELQKIQHNMIETLSAVDSGEHLKHFISTFQGIDEMPNVEIEKIGAFLKEAVFSSGLLSTEKFLEKNALWKQQERLAVGIEAFGTVSDERRKLILISAEELSGLLRIGKEKEVQKKTDDILSLILLESLQDANQAKAFLATVVAVLSMNLLLKGEKWSKVITVNNIYLEEIEKITDIKELCFWFERLALKLFRNVRIERKGENVSEKVISYIHRHFNEKVRLCEVAKFAGESTSGIMHKIKKETGTTFSHHLNSVRVKEAKRLLAFTSLSLGEISVRCGFKDQSYFTKVFSGTVNIGPREFRKMLISGNQ
ncbi:MAG: helix-turn-helix domain-containing protein [Victivallales bacterium]